MSARDAFPSGHSAFEDQTHHQTYVCEYSMSQP